MTKKLDKFVFITFILFFIRWEQAYSADHLILQDLDTACQDDGSLCSDVEIVSFNDLDSDQKDLVIEMIASSAMDGYSYNSTLNLDEFSNSLSHSDEIANSSDLPYVDLPYAVYNIEATGASSVSIFAISTLIGATGLMFPLPLQRIFLLIAKAGFAFSILNASALVAFRFYILKSQSMNYTKYYRYMQENN